MDARGAVIAAELYDLALDPFQPRSLHDDTSPPRVLQRLLLKRELDALKSCANGTCQKIEAQ